MIQAVIFDMDGLLIDSEPLWREAEIRIFSQVGITLTEDDRRKTMGFRTDEVIKYWYDRYPWKSKSLEEIEEDLWDEGIAIIKEKGKKRPGVTEILEFFKQKEIPVALASSSSMRLIEVIVDKLDIRNYFQELYSAESEEYGKPHPAVYITTAKKLNVSPENCLALEDSLVGLVSAKAARMKCISVPDESLVGDNRLSIADVVLRSLEEFNKKVWKDLNA